MAMKKLLLAGIAALLMASTAYAQQGNLPKPVQKLPAYPPVVCVAPNWATEPCESRHPKPETRLEPKPKPEPKPIDPKLREYLSDKMEVVFSDGASQEVLHHYCPKEPTDRVIVACSTVSENSEKLTCHILFAPDDVILAHSRWRDRRDLFVNRYDKCVQEVSDVIEAIGAIGRAYGGGK
jgi:hypothetical protein